VADGAKNHDRLGDPDEQGLEVIEAHWLFGARADQIDVVIHPQSVVHSFVELVDGSLIAQLGMTDMRLPIQYAFSYPDRWTSPLPTLDLVRAGRLDFDVPDTDAFPCLQLAYRALDAEQSLPVVLNAANEVAVGPLPGGADRLPRHPADHRGDDGRACSGSGPHLAGSPHGRRLGTQFFGGNRRRIQLRV
jgi:hypothetical protein